MRVLFTITVFLGALLPFGVQPLIGKLLLLRLGGTPSVWNTCMVFFQAALLARYVYDNGILTARRVVVAHSDFDLVRLRVDPGWRRIEVPDDAPVWTDDSSNMSTIMQWWR